MPKDRIRTQRYILTHAAVEPQKNENRSMHIYSFQENLREFAYCSRVLSVALSI